MNKMFQRIEAELKSQGKNKVWLAGQLGESTQNLNNWKVRTVPAIKVLSIARALSVSREFLEDHEPLSSQSVATTKGDYAVSPKGPLSINYTVYIDASDAKVKKLLSKDLEVRDGLSFISATAFTYVAPFVELDVWRGADRAPSRVYLLLDCIVGIKTYPENNAD